MLKWLKRKDVTRMSDVISFAAIFILIQLLPTVYSLNGWVGFLVVIVAATSVFSALKFLTSRLLKEKDKEMKTGMVFLTLAILTAISSYCSSFYL